MQERYDDAVKWRENLPADDGAVGRGNGGLLDVGIEFGDLHFELAFLDLQLVSAFGELELLNLLLGDAAGALPLNRQSPFKLGDGDCERSVGIPHLNVVLCLRE